MFHLQRVLPDSNVCAVALFFYVFCQTVHISTNTSAWNSAPVPNCTQLYPFSVLSIGFRHTKKNLTTNEYWLTMVKMPIFYQPRLGKNPITLSPKCSQVPKFGTDWFNVNQYLVGLMQFCLYPRVGFRVLYPTLDNVAILVWDQIKCIFWHTLLATRSGKKVRAEE